MTRNVLKAQTDGCFLFLSFVWKGRGNCGFGFRAQAPAQARSPWGSIVTICRRAVSEAVSPFGVWYHYTAVLSDRKVVYSWFLLFLPTSSTSSSAICRTAELQLQITSNRSVNVYVSLLIVLAGGLAMKVTSGANQSSF